jgi:acetylornithine/succinyldiaminopimelate/putrescine aminotransferase
MIMSLTLLVFVTFLQRPSLKTALSDQDVAAFLIEHTSRGWSICPLRWVLKAARELAPKQCAVYAEKYKPDWGTGKLLACDYEKVRPTYSFLAKPFLEECTQSRAFWR